MDAKEILDYCLQKKGAIESFPFDKDTLVVKVATKMFLLMNLEKFPLSINVKTNPQWSLELRERYEEITPGYHMNKTHWNTIKTATLERKLICELIDHSYELVYKSLPKIIQIQIQNDSL